MLSNIVSVYSETSTLTQLGTKVLLQVFPERIRLAGAAPPTIRRHCHLTYVPVDSVRQAAELTSQGGLLIWLGASMKKLPDPLLDPTVAIRGVNSVLACRRAVEIAGAHLLTPHELDRLTLVLLPSFLRVRTHSPSLAR